MRHPKHPVNARIRLSLLALALVLSLGAADTARAAPANDNFADAMWIEALPFFTGGYYTDLTTERHEPSPCGGIGATVWYRFAPSTDILLTADTFNSNYDTVLAVYTGSKLGNLTLVGCNDNASWNNAKSEVVFAAAAGVTYHFQVGGFEGAQGPYGFNLNARTVAPNDNFADAMQITSLPYSDFPDTSLATMEPGEPAGCVESASVWYRFTPSSTVGISARSYSEGYDTVLAVYLDTGVGTGFERLSGQGCGSHNAFTAVASNTYYFQVGAFETTGGGRLRFYVSACSLPTACV